MRSLFSSMRSPIICFWTLVTLALLFLPGCSGCAELFTPADQADATQGKDKKKPIDPFELGPLQVMPYSSRLVKSPVETEAKDKEKKEAVDDFYSVSGERKQMLKPGHWMTATQGIRSNIEDFRGNLVVQAMFPNMLRAVPVPQTPFELRSSRPVILPEKRRRYLDSDIFIPSDQKSIRLSAKLLGPAGTQVVSGIQGRDTAVYMRAHESYFMILAADHNSYTFYKNTYSIKPPKGDDYSSVLGDNVRTDPNQMTSSGRDISLTHDIYYYVVTPQLGPKMPLPLPEHALTWTSISYLLWDNIDPELLNDNQRQALIDWIHFGGQLIVSGPGSLESLRGTWIEPWLPAETDGAVNLDSDAMKYLNDKWSTGSATNPDRLLKLVRPLVGANLIARGSPKINRVLLERATDGGPLVIERQVGYGRIVVTSFRLNDPQLYSWKSFDNFINGCLLRRPGRKYSEVISISQLDWSLGGGNRFDGRLLSRVGFFSRDDRIVSQPAPVVQRYPGFGGGGGIMKKPMLAPISTAQWCDLGDVSSAARLSLKNAAGIEIPRASFVLWVLVLYLIALVPANYALFRLLGRLEWAWAAVPVLAVVAAVVIVHQTQLNIGFQRARTEIGVIEAHAGYSRAHATRYTALYTSLTTSFELDFNDPSALAQPFGISESYQLQPGQSLRTAEYRRGPEGVKLSNIDVLSNSTGLVRSEQMFDLGGVFSLRQADDKWTLNNGTNLNLSAAEVIRLSDTWHLETAHIGDLASGESIVLGFVTAGTNQSANQDMLSKEDLPALEASRSAKKNSLKPLDLTSLWQLATSISSRPGSKKEQPLPALHTLLAPRNEETASKSAMLQVNNRYIRIRPGETRLVARIDEELPGVSEKPFAAKKTCANLLVVHLQNPIDPPPESDRNSIADLNLPTVDLFDTSANRPPEF